MEELRGDRNGYVRALIMRTVQESNILPLTSSCNLACLFCSHRQNPPGLEVFRVPSLSPGEIEELFAWLDPSRPVVIGESATRIIEGEPLVHPHWVRVFRSLRRAFPATPVQVTTNGTRLDREAVDVLAGLRPLTVCLSLNSADPRIREILLGDREPFRAVRAVELLAGAGIPFHGSIVAMPHVTGWDDLERTIGYLASHGAQTVRVFLPGHTRYAAREGRIPEDLWTRVSSFLEDIRDKISVPLLVEPAQVRDLVPRATGVIPSSPAAQAGLRSGDVVRRVAGDRILSRADAYWRLWRAADPLVEVERDHETFRVQLRKGTRRSAGLVFEHDVDPRDLKLIMSAARRICDHTSQLAGQVFQQSPGRVLVLTGTLAAPLLEMACRAAGMDGMEVQAVENRFFGGTIGCAGLLVVEDLAEALRRRIASGCRPDLVLLPAGAFDYRGRDLRGWSVQNLADEFGVEVRTL
ncbi:DUF512 domain-containing protein [Desulforudis sp. 1088]|uniref:DUF512 domain-containing protein n=2 Tax=Candidatus Desulforudis TaxID=471826 RepID=UPI003CE4D205